MNKFRNIAGVGLMSLLCLSGIINAQTPKTAAILIFDGVQIVDYTGPYEVLGYGFNVITVSPKPGMITTTMGMKVTPDYSIENCPAPNVLILPGGSGLVKSPVVDPNLIKWIQETAKTAEVVMSVCNGAFFLQKAGLLDGLEATTTAGYIDSLQQLLPTAKVVRNKRFTDNGKIMTTAGLSSGIDGAIHIAGKLLGRGWEPIFARWLEYNWNPESGYTAASLADCNVSNLMRLFYFTIDTDPLTYAGDTNKWSSELLVKSGTSVDSLFKRLNQEILDRLQWKLNKADAANGISTWSFIGKDKNSWTGELRIKPTAKKGESNVMIKINRI